MDSLTERKEHLQVINARLEEWDEKSWAEKNVGQVPQEEAFRVLDELCSLYLASTPEQCAEIRNFIKDRTPIRLRLFDSYAVKGVDLIKGKRDARPLRLALAAVSINDNQPGSYHDTAQVLKLLIQQAKRDHINPVPHFQEVAKLSSTEGTDGESMQDYLANYFAEETDRRSRNIRRSIILLVVLLSIVGLCFGLIYLVLLSA
jgi:hypothetical protein